MHIPVAPSLQQTAEASAALRSLNPNPNYEGFVPEVILRERSRVVSCLQVQEVQPQEVRRQQLIERSMMVNGAWQYLWCSVLHDAPFAARDISVDICGPSLASFEWVRAALCVILAFWCDFLNLA
jgi:hypothetical protein